MQTPGRCIAALIAPYRWKSFFVMKARWAPTSLTVRSPHWRPATVICPVLAAAVSASLQALRGAAFGFPDHHVFGKHQALRAEPGGGVVKRKRCAAIRPGNASTSFTCRTSAGFEVGVAGHRRRARRTAS